MVRQTEAHAPRHCLAKKEEALLLPYFLILAADVVEEYFAASKAVATDEGGAEDWIMVYFLLTPSKKWRKSEPNKNCPCHSSKIWHVRKWSTKMAHAYDDRWLIVNLGKFKNLANTMESEFNARQEFYGNSKTRQTHWRVNLTYPANTLESEWDSSTKWVTGNAAKPKRSLRKLQSGQIPLSSDKMRPRDVYLSNPEFAAFDYKCFSSNITVDSSANCWRAEAIKRWQWSTCPWPPYLSKDGDSKQW